jgi:hypothetical protein
MDMILEQINERKGLHVITGDMATSLIDRALGNRVDIRNLNNAVMGFWTVQRGLTRQFFTHIRSNLICRQLFNPNMQADLP